jgi:hypothetical protein
MVVENFQLDELEEIVDLSDEQQKAIIGGAAQCTYKGQTSSEGSVVKMDDGVTRTCLSNGKWG